MRNTDSLEAININRRNVLRGGILAGAAAAVVGAVNAAQAAPLPSVRKSFQMSKTAAHLISEVKYDRAKSADHNGYERVKQILVAPPFAPEHQQVAKGNPKIVEVTLEIQEKKLVVDEDTGASIWALTYNGSVPGPLIVVHEDDYVELTLRNPESNIMEHNIDLHAATGAMGCGDLTHVLPGEETVVRFKAVKSGVFTYHCAPGGEMIPYHVTHGMNGAIMVLPRDGLKDRDGNGIAKSFQKPI